jgi:hypothetical protein
MKQLLTVTAIFLCAYLTEGFITPDREKHAARTPGIHNHSAKWKYSTWVNPWAGAKKFNGSQKSLTDVTVYYLHEMRYPDLVFQQRMNAGVYQGCDAKQNGETFGDHTYTIAGGDYIGFETYVHPSLSGLTVFVRDETTNQQLFYQDTGFWATYGFYSEPGHTYSLYSLTQ